MEKKEDGIFVSNVFLESMQSNLRKHCRECSLYDKHDGAHCLLCSVLEVIDDLRFICEFSGDEHE